MILYHRYALAGHVSEEMKNYVTTKDCRRKVLLSIYCETVEMSHTFNCCDNCSIQFSCCSCGTADQCNHVTQDCYCIKFCFQYQFMRQTITPASSHNLIRSEIVGENYKKCLSDMHSLRTNFITAPSNVTNFYPELITNIMKNHTAVVSAADIVNMGALSQANAEQLLDILDKYSSLLDHSGLTSPCLSHTSSDTDSCD